MALTSHTHIPMCACIGRIDEKPSTSFNLTLWEVGAVGIDNQLLKAGDAKRTEESVTLLDNGCLCCTVRGDLVKAITDIVNAAKAKDKISAASRSRKLAAPNATSCLSFFATRVA